MHCTYKSVSVLSHMHMFIYMETKARHATSSSVVSSLLITIAKWELLYSEVGWPCYSWELPVSASQCWAHRHTALPRFLCRMLKIQTQVLMLVEPCLLPPEIALCPSSYTLLSPLPSIVMFLKVWLFMSRWLMVWYPVLPRLLSSVVFPQLTQL